MADEYLIVVLHYHLSLGCRTNVLHSNQTQIHQREATYVVQIRRIDIIWSVEHYYYIIVDNVMSQFECHFFVSCHNAMSSIIDIDIVAGEHPDPRLNLALDLVVMNMFYTSLWPCP